MATQFYVLSVADDLYLPAHALTHEPGGADDLYLWSGSQSVSAVETVPRLLAVNNTSLTSGAVYFSYFTPPRALTVSTMQVCVAGTGATGLTHFLMGLYTVDGSSNLTLVARTLDDTAALGSQNTLYSEAIARDSSGATISSYALAQGTRYAAGILISVSTTMPILSCRAGNQGMSALSPVLAIRSSTTNNTTMPTSLTYSGGTATGQIPWCWMS